VKKWGELQRKLSSFGASDTEPDGVFQHCLRQTVDAAPLAVPSTAQDWQLYTGVTGVGTAARRLTVSLKRCIKALEAIPLGEKAELDSYLDGILWRA